MKKFPKSESVTFYSLLGRKRRRVCFCVRLIERKKEGKGDSRKSFGENQPPTNQRPNQTKVLAVHALLRQNGILVL
jgi:hypothetical protein